MLGTARLMAFAATSDAARARAFYEDALGLRMVADEPFAVVFDANGVHLRVQKVEAVRPPPYTVLGWEVSDIHDTIRALGALGVVFERFGMPQDELGVWTSESGAKVAWCKDPDGNLLSLTEFPR